MKDVLQPCRYLARTFQRPVSGNASPFQQGLRGENEQNPFNCNFSVQQHLHEPKEMMKLRDLILKSILYLASPLRR